MDSAIGELNYEQAFAELEQVVARLETDALDLDESLKLYERGQALAAHCSNLLRSAELKVEQLKSEIAISKEDELED